MIRAVAGEPAVAQVIGRPRLAGHLQARVQPLCQPVGGTFPYHTLQGHGEQVGGFRRHHRLHLQRVVLQRRAIHRHHFANGPQGYPETTAGKGLIHLGDLPGGQIHRPQYQRGKGSHLLVQPEPLQGGDHRGDAQIQAQACRGHVIGMHQRLVEGHGTMKLLVIVLRLPGFPGRLFEAQGFIL